MSAASWAEAAALYELQTGEAVATGDAARMRAEEHLRKDRARLSVCGACEACKEHRLCSRVRNVQAQHKGKRAAQWAEEGDGLRGRTFEVRL